MSAVWEDSLRTPVGLRGGRHGGLAPRVVRLHSQYNSYNNACRPSAASKLPSLGNKKRDLLLLLSCFIKPSNC